MATKTDIVFVKPSAMKALYGDLGAFDLPASEPPLWAALLAAHLRKQGYGVALLDPEAEGWDYAETARQALACDPRLVAVVAMGANPSASTMSMTGARALLEALNERDAASATLLMGLHPTALPERTLREEPVDYVCQGEGFLTLPLLLDALKAGTENPDVPGLWRRENGAPVSTPPPALYEDLDDLPMPAWDLLPMERYRAHNWHCFDHIESRQPYGVIYSSFGCPFRCNFCCTNALFGRPGIRYRSPERVVDEIDYLVNTHGIRNIKILDEMFVLHKDHVHRICDLIIERGYDLNMWAYARVNTVDPELLDKLKRAGVNWVAYGFEAGSPAVLESASKGYDIEKVAPVVQMTYDAGLYILGNYMFGLPEEDMESMQATLDMALEINAEWANMYTVMALPGTQLYREVLDKGWALPGTWAGYSQYGYDSLPLPTRALTPAQVLAFRDEAFHMYYTNANYLAKIERTFGRATLAHVREMTSHRLRRRLLEDTTTTRSEE